MHIAYVHKVRNETSNRSLEVLMPAPKTPAWPKSMNSSFQPVADWQTHSNAYLQKIHPKSIGLSNS